MHGLQSVDNLMTSVIRLNNKTVYASCAWEQYLLIILDIYDKNEQYKSEILNFRHKQVYTAFKVGFVMIV